MRRWIGVALLAGLLGACQTPTPPMPISEAKQVAATFSGAEYVPPPRTITDNTAILDEQPIDRGYHAAVMARLAATPPANADAATLSVFYRDRAYVLQQAGMFNEAVASAEESVRYARQAPTVSCLSRARLSATDRERSLAMLAYPILASTTIVVCKEAPYYGEVDLVGWLLESGTFRVWSRAIGPRPDHLLLTYSRWRDG